MLVYASFGDPRLAPVPRQENLASSGDRIMSRRHIAYAALVVTSLVLGACAQPTAPVGTDTTCRGVVSGQGNKCTPE